MRRGAFIVALCLIEKLLNSIQTDLLTIGCTNICLSTRLFSSSSTQFREFAMEN